MKTDEFLAQDQTVRKSWYGDGEQPYDTAVRLGWGPAFAATKRDLITSPRVEALL